MESLEQRQLLSSTPVLATAVTAPNLTTGIFRPPVEYNLKYLHDVQMGLPMLDSNPGAPATLDLDFTGDTQSDWFSYNVTDSSGNPIHFKNFSTPAFDTDGDATKFSATEQSQIQEIWARVAEDYAPFNINVTTHYYGSFNDRQALHVVIGGTGDWITNPTSGISSIGSFTDNAPNAVFIFSGNIVNWAKAGDTDNEGKAINITAATATSISHESGHAFGLRHHAVYDAQGNKINDYSKGTADWTPIMGNNLSSDRTTWYNGPNDQGATVLQDDMAILGGSNNGFGFRADDHGTTMATAEALTLTQNPSSIYVNSPATGSVQGLIEQTSDFDVFKVQASYGTLRVEVDPAQFGPNLMPRVEIWNSQQTLAVYALAYSTPTPAVINLTVGTGTYYVFVESYGDYGDVGQYTLTVTNTPQMISKAPNMATVSGPVTITNGLTSQSSTAPVQTLAAAPSPSGAGVSLLTTTTQTTAIGGSKTGSLKAGTPGGVLPHLLTVDLAVFPRLV